MIITIRNLTSNAITAHTYPSQPSKFSARFHHKKVATKPASDDPTSSSEFTLRPLEDFTIELPKGFTRELVLRRDGVDPRDLSGLNTPVIEKKGLLENKEWHIHPEDFKIRFSMSLGASWQVVPVPDHCPWRIYTRRITQGHHKLLILGRRNLGSFLSELPDRLPISSVVLPGTHDTMAFHGWPISQCQSPSTLLSTQLLGGIRIIDIRLAVIPPPSPVPDNISRQLIAYHGLWPQKTSFVTILHDIHTFLTSPIGSKETIVMSIKQEDFAVTPSPFFSQMVRETIIKSAGGWDDSKPSKTGINRGMWFLENRIPTLGEVRGKVVMFSRFGGNGAGWERGLEGIGIHPTTWPDSAKEGFEWELRGTLVRTQDWYGIPTFFSIPEKVRLATANLIPPSDASQPILPITYFSAASFPLAFPPTVAKGFGWPKWGLGIEGVNSRLGAWLLDQLGGSQQSAVQIARSDGCEDEKLRENKEAVAEEPRIRGWTFLDYYAEPEGGDIVPLLVECNYRGRKSGEEGW